MPKKILLKSIWWKILMDSAKVSEDIPNTINESCKDITYENPPQIIFQKPIFCTCISLYQPRRLQESLRTHHWGHLIQVIRDILIFIPHPLFWLPSIHISVQLHRHRRQGNDPRSGLSAQLRQQSAIARTSGRRLLSNPNPRIPHPPIRQLHVHRSCRRSPPPLSSQHSLHSLDIYSMVSHPSLIKGMGREKQGFTMFNLLDRTKTSLGRQLLKQ